MEDVFAESEIWVSSDVFMSDTPKLLSLTLKNFRIFFVSGPAQLDHKKLLTSYN